MLKSLSGSGWESSFSRAQSGGKERVGALVPQPVPHSTVTVPGTWTPPVQGSVFPTGGISSDSSHRSFAKETAWSQQPGTATGREAVEKAKAGTENILSTLTRLKPSLITDAWSKLVLISSQSLHLCSAPQPPFLSSFPIVHYKFPRYLVFLIPKQYSSAKERELTCHLSSQH